MLRVYLGQEDCRSEYRGLGLDWIADCRSSGHVLWHGEVRPKNHAVNSNSEAGAEIKKDFRTSLYALGLASDGRPEAVQKPKEAQRT